MDRLDRKILRLLQGELHGSPWADVAKKVALSTDPPCWRRIQKSWKEEGVIRKRVGAGLIRVKINARVNRLCVDPHPILHSPRMACVGFLRGGAGIPRGGRVLPHERRHNDYLLRVVGAHIADL